jgi:hypothetical protein
MANYGDFEGLQGGARPEHQLPDVLGAGEDVAADEVGIARGVIASVASPS